MKKHILKYFLMAAMALSLPFSSGAWGLLGHRIVGQVAEFYLTKKAKKAISELLDGESLAICSNYADFIKSDTTYRYVSSWHYVNFPSGLSKSQVTAQLQSDTMANAYNRINFLMGEIKKPTLDKTTRAFYLKLLVHIAGDVHQPMHAGRFEDLGGNKIKVMWFNDPYNLHQIWDEVLIDFQQLSYTEYANAINLTSPAKIKTWQSAPVSDWIFESYMLAQGIYADVKEPNEKLGYAYNFKYKAVMENQLLKGGIRLAGILNTLFQ